MYLSRIHQHTLLNLAEWSIQNFLDKGSTEAFPNKFSIDEVLNRKMGAFVSVYVAKKLRGCIGTFSESEPLFENVQKMAVQAAFEDRRFQPVRESDLARLHVEISVLLPRIKIQGPEDIVIGKHGIYMIHGIRRATLLPQVADKNKWTAVDFLECCAENKLGLSKDSWKEAELFVYEAEVF